MWSPARSIGVVSSPPTVATFGPSWPGSRRRVRWPSRWRAAPAGGVVEELERAGIGAHLAEPAETAAKRGRKRPRQDRPVRRPPPAGAAGEGRPARVVDPTG